MAEANDRMLGALRRTALHIFNQHAELSEFDPRKQERVAKQRRKLQGELWPRPRPAADSSTSKVTS